jgi:hypothetical protein
MRKNNCFIRRDGGGTTTAPPTFLMMLLKRFDTKITSRQKARTANTDGWGNKLVTIFARHLDCFIVTRNLSLICQIRDFGSGQILRPRQLYLSPGFAKIAPWWLARRDDFSAEVPGLVSADGATNVYSLNRRAVSGH